MNKTNKIILITLFLSLFFVFYNQSHAQITIISDVIISECSNDGPVISIIWEDDNPTEDDYIIWRDDDEIGRVSFLQNLYFDYDILGNQEYTYYIEQNGRVSEPVSVTALACQPRLELEGSCLSEEPGGPRMSLEWNDLGVDSYTIYKSQGIGPNFEPFEILQENITETNYNDDLIDYNDRDKNRIQYYIKANWEDGIDTEDFQGKKEITIPICSPYLDYNLICQTGELPKIELNWTPTLFKDLEQYRILRNSGNDYELMETLENINILSSDDFLTNDICPDQDCQVGYKIEARGADGFFRESNEIIIDVDCEPIPDPQPDPNITELKTVCFLDDETYQSNVLIKWEPTQYADFVIYRRTQLEDGTYNNNWFARNKSLETEEKITPREEDWFFYDNLVSEDITYQYYIEAIGMSGVNINGEIEAVKVLSCGEPQSAQITNINHSCVEGKNKAIIYWQPFGDGGAIQYYEVWKGTDQNNLSFVEGSRTMDPFYEDNNIDSNQEYSYRIRAYGLPKIENDQIIDNYKESEPESTEKNCDLITPILEITQKCSDLNDPRGVGPVNEIRWNNYDSGRVQRYELTRQDGSDDFPVTGHTSGSYSDYVEHGSKYVYIMTYYGYDDPENSLSFTSEEIEATDCSASDPNIFFSLSCNLGDPIISIWLTNIINNRVQRYELIKQDNTLICSDEGDLLPLWVNCTDNNYQEGQSYTAYYHGYVGSPKSKTDTPSPDCSATTPVFNNIEPRCSEGKSEIEIIIANINNDRVQRYELIRQDGVLICSDEGDSLPHSSTCLDQDIIEEVSYIYTLRFIGYDGEAKEATSDSIIAFDCGPTEPELFQISRECRNGNSVIISQWTNLNSNRVQGYELYRINNGNEELLIPGGNEDAVIEYEDIFDDNDDHGQLYQYRMEYIGYDGGVRKTTTTEEIESEVCFLEDFDVFLEFRCYNDGPNISPHPLARILFTESSNTDLYLIYRNTTGLTFGSYGSFPSDALSGMAYYIDGTSSGNRLVSGQEYTWKVIAFNYNSHIFNLEKEATGTTPICVPSLPHIELTTFCQGPGSDALTAVRISWNETINTERYEVYRRNNGIYTMIANLPLGQTSFDDINLPQTQEQHYYVRAIGPEGLTRDSSIVSIITPICEPPDPVDPDYVYIGSGCWPNLISNQYRPYIGIGWRDVEGADLWYYINRTPKEPIPSVNSYEILRTRFPGFIIELIENLVGTPYHYLRIGDTYMDHDYYYSITSRRLILIDGGIQEVRAEPTNTPTTTTPQYCDPYFYNSNINRYCNDRNEPYNIISWQDNRDPIDYFYTKKFNIYRNEFNILPLDPIVTIEPGDVSFNSKSWTDYSVNNITNYYYWIEAVGEENSFFVEDLNGTKIPLSITTYDCRPPTPTLSGEISCDVDDPVYTLSWQVDTSLPSFNNNLEYRVYRNLLPYPDGSTTINNTSYIDSNLENDIVYSYRVRTLNSISGIEGENQSNQISLREDCLNPPEVPSNLSGAIFCRSFSGLPNYFNLPGVSLNWDGVSGNRIGYRVYRNNVSINDYTEDIFYTDNSLLNNTVYDYRVRAINLNSGKISSFSNLYSTDGLNCLPDAPSLSGIRNCRDDDNLPKIELNWNSVGSNLRYRIYRQESGGSFISYFVTGTNITSYTDTNLQNNTAYSYRIRAFNRLNWNLTSELSNLVEFDDNLNCLPFAPEVDLVIHCGDTEDKNNLPKIELNWNSVGSNLEYRIYRQIDNEGFSYYTTTNNTSYTDTNLQNNTAYSYQIIAVNKNNETLNSGFSDPVSTDGLDCSPLCPDLSPIVNCTAANNPYIEITWPEDENTKHWLIYSKRETDSNFSGGLLIDYSYYYIQGLEYPMGYKYRVAAIGYNPSVQCTIELDRYLQVQLCANVPDPVINLEVRPACLRDSSRIKLSWEITDLERTEHFNILRKEENESQFNIIAFNIDKKSTNYNDLISIENVNKNYQYAVQSVGVVSYLISTTGQGEINYYSWPDQEPNQEDVMAPDCVSRPPLPPDIEGLNFFSSFISAKQYNSVREDLENNLLENIDESFFSTIYARWQNSGNETGYIIYRGPIGNEEEINNIRWSEEDYDPYAEPILYLDNYQIIDGRNYRYRILAYNEDLNEEVSGISFSISTNIQRPRAFSLEAERLTDNIVNLSWAEAYTTLGGGLVSYSLKGSTFYDSNGPDSQFDTWPKICEIDDYIGDDTQSLECLDNDASFAQIKHYVVVARNNSPNPRYSNVVSLKILPPEWEEVIPGR